MAGPVGAQQARCRVDGVDRVVRVRDAVAVRVDAVAGPGARHELHPADRAGAGGGQVAAERRLDAVDRRQHRPRHAVAARGRAIDRDEVGRDLGGRTRQVHAGAGAAGEPDQHLAVGRQPGQRRRQVQAHGDGRHAAAGRSGAAARRAAAPAPSRRRARRRRGSRRAAGRRRRRRRPPRSSCGRRSHGRSGSCRRAARCRGRGARRSPPPRRRPGRRSRRPGTRSRPARAPSRWSSRRAPRCGPDPADADAVAGSASVGHDQPQRERPFTPLSVPGRSASGYAFVRVRLVAGLLRRDVPRPLVLPHDAGADGAGGRRHRGRDHPARRAAPGPDRRSGVRRRAHRGRSRGPRPPRHGHSTTRPRMLRRRARSRSAVRRRRSSSSRPTCAPRTSTSRASTSRSPGSRRSATSTSRPTTCAALESARATLAPGRPAAARDAAPRPGRGAPRRRVAAAALRGASRRHRAARLWFDPVRGRAGEHVRHCAPTARRGPRSSRSRVYSATELVALCAAAGLALEAVYGGPGPTPFGVSTRLLVVARRAA